jgi:hypothetical protein
MGGRTKPKWAVYVHRGPDPVPGERVGIGPARNSQAEPPENGAARAHGQLGEVQGDGVGGGDPLGQDG